MPTLLFADDFSDLATADLAKRYNTVGAATVNTGTGRGGSNSLRGSAGDNDLVKWTLPSALSTLAAGIAISAATPPTAGNRLICVAFLNAGTSHVDARWLSDGTFQITRNGTVLGTSTASRGGGYFHVELEATIGNTGSAKLYLDGDPTPIIDLSGVDTQNGATTTATEVGLSGHGSTGLSSIDHDDFTISTGRIGDKRVKTLAVIADGALQDFAVGAGSGTHHLNVDDSTPDDDTTHNDATAAAQQETYVCADPNAGENIFAFIVEALLKKTDAGSVTASALVRHSGVNYVGATSFVPSDSAYKYFREIYQTHPGTGAAPIVADLTGGVTEVGIKRVT